MRRALITVSVVVGDQRFESTRMTAGESGPAVAAAVLAEASLVAQHLASSLRVERRDEEGPR